jgi:hypothetical protein
MKVIFSGRRWLPCIVAGFAAALVISPAAGAAGKLAPGTGGVAGATSLTPSTQITLDHGVLTNPWSNPRVTPASVRSPVFRPTVSGATYKALKQQAASSPQGKTATASSPSRLNVIGNLGGFTGAQQDGPPNPCGCYPPDVNAAANGTAKIFEIVNSDIRITNGAGTLSCPEVSINTFFGYSATLLFDPRVLYNYRRNVWILEAEGDKETSTGPQYQFFAASTSSNPCGTYKKYALNMSAIIGTANFWDYPQIGQNQDGVIFTGNNFGPSSYLGACTFQFSIDELIRPTGSSSFVYCGGSLNSTTTPPEVIDNSPVANMITVPTSGTSFTHTYWNAPGHDLYSLLFGNGSWTVTTYSVPPNAPQPGTSVLLDTLDSRAVNDTAQVGTSLFMAHTVALGSFSSPRWYELDTSTNAVPQQAYKFLSGTSFDFNTNIQANTSKRVILEWSATDPPAGVNASVVAAGRLVGDAAGTMGTAINLFASPTAQTDNLQNGTSRWGDTSSVRFVSPFSSTAVIANETVQSSGTQWSTRIQKVTIS